MAALAKAGSEEPAFVVWDQDFRGIFLWRKTRNQTKPSAAPITAQAMTDIPHEASDRPVRRMIT